ncbi:MAG: sensor histidine kinase [Pseudonocardiaceae bacterium]|nr:sensor histidine kinase [Pseudonocardiaceae bacterium]
MGTRHDGTGADGVVRGGAGAVPGHIPVDEQPELTSGTAPEDAWVRSFWLWDVYFAIGYLLAVGLTLADESELSRRLVVVAALSAIAIGYLAVGRRIMRTDDNVRHRLTFLAAVLAAFLVAVLAEPSAGFGLFAICPMVFMTVSLRVAAVIVAVAIMLPVLSAILRDGVTDVNLAMQLPISGMLVAFAVFIGWWLDRVIRQSEQRRELIEKLEASRAEVSRLSHEAGIAGERERLAAEIHDTLAQGFASIVTLAQAAESTVDAGDAQTRKHLSLLARTARENLAESRALVAALAPSALETGTLDAALCRQLEQLASELGARVDHQIDGTPGPLRTSVEVVLLRAGQEAMTNIRKHAHADSVVLRLAYTESAVCLTITDNGAGFDPAEPTDGFGLRGMRRRVEQVGGTLSVHSGPGEGTRVAVEVPR